MNAPTYQRNQTMQFAIVMFGSIVAAVVLSTVIIMSLMRGELASALTSNVNSTSAQNVCVDPTATATAEESEESVATNPASLTSTWLPAGSISGSFNVSTTTTNTETTNIYTDNSKVITKTIIKDNGNTYTFAPVDNTTIVRDNGNTYEDNDTNVNTNTNTSTTNTSVVTTTIQDNGNTNNQNNGNTSVVAPVTNTSVSDNDTTVVEDNDTTVNVIDNDGVDIL